MIDKIAAVFDDLLGERRLPPLRRRASSTRDRQRDGRTTGPAVVLSPIEIRPEPFQERLLEQIAVARQPGHHRNLLVSATGTGKTVMAAVDYADSRDAAAGRLLFVAHRQEILDQSQRHVPPRAARPRRSASTGSAAPTEAVRARLRVDPEPRTRPGWSHLPPDHFDVVIVDEFHHAAAPSLRAAARTRPPRRAPGADRHARAGRRLPSCMVRRSHRRRAAAVGRDRPAPPHPVRLLRHPRRTRSARGAVAARPRLRRRRPDQPLHANDAWARLVVKQLADHVDDSATMRVPRVLRQRRARAIHGPRLQTSGVAAVAVWGDTREPSGRRRSRDLPPGGCRSSSPSTCSTRASTSRWSTRC